MKQPRLPKINSSRISVDSVNTKNKLIEIAEKKDETLKETIVRLVDDEYKNISEVK